MRHCHPKKLYYVALGRFVATKNGWRSFIATPSLGQARYYAKKLKRQQRQIDVRERGKEPYVMRGSWL